jgi:glycogen operon protein
MTRASIGGVGSPQPLGASCTAAGVNFALFSEHAENVELCLFDTRAERVLSSFYLPGRSGNVWHGIVPGDIAGPGSIYGFRVFGPGAGPEGHRFDATSILLDPYARDVVGSPPRGIVVDAHFDWQGDRAPSIPWRDSIIYELHVKGFTARHPDVPPAWRGKYLGLTVPSVINHIKSLGVTAVELMPVQAFLDEGFLRDRGLVNYWGYNPIAWFAPDRRYATLDPIGEFKSMVRCLHLAGIEVILDVVFNHTAEGNELGPTLSFRGIDNSVYYRLAPGDGRHYENFTGCGNTVNCEHPVVRRLIIDNLRYWAEEMHVDGFRFDLAPVLARDQRGFDRHAEFFKALRAEPSLAYLKMIAEPWDLGPGGYQLGNFPSGWSEWNDRYRDTMRAFWRGDSGRVGEFADGLAGSSDIFRRHGRKPTASINLIAAHDGFTLRDVVSYEHRHNEANLENNSDGHAHNLSCNHGAEGATADLGVLKRRDRHVRGLLATLFLSQGVPMLQAGDEFARTQLGNNNAYCQDNEISWLDWSGLEEQRELVEFVRRLIRLRMSRRELRRETFLKGMLRRWRAKDIGWFTPAGDEMGQEQWRDSGVLSLAVRIGAGYGGPQDLLLLVNAGESPVDFKPPRTHRETWVVVFDTAATPAFSAAELFAPDAVRVQDGAAVLLVARNEPTSV